MSYSFQLISGFLFFLFSVTLLWFMPFMAAVGISCTLIALFLISFRFGYLRPLCWTLLLASFFALTSVFLKLHDLGSQTVAQWNDRQEEQIVRGTIIDEPDVRLDHIKYTVSISDIRLSDGSFVPASGNILINAAKFPSFQPSDQILAKGVLTTPPEFEGFSYKNFLLRHRIVSLLNEAIIDLRASRSSEGFSSYLWKYKDLFMRTVNRLYFEPEASFMAGILIGARRGISEKVMEQFNITGLTHIIAISGYNITIVITIIMGLLSFLPRKIAFVMAIFAIVLFTIFVGASAAVVRAAIMGILGLIAMHSGRDANPSVTILASASLMVFFNPLILFFDAGFQLSFLAVFGLVYVAPHIEVYFEWLPNVLSIRESIVMTLSAQVAALPLIIFLFHRLSIISPFSNLFVAPFLPFAMFFGFASVLAHWIFAPLGVLLAFIGHNILSFVLWIIKICSFVPYASVDMPKISIILFIGYYVFLACVLLRNKEVFLTADLSKFKQM